VEMSYVCAYSYVQLDKRHVEKEFTWIDDDCKLCVTKDDAF